MTEQKDYYQYSSKLGDDIVVLRRDHSVGVDAFLEEADAFRKKVVEKFPSAASQGASHVPSETRVAKFAPDGTKSFQVEAIKLAAGGENPRWSVMGGNFKKFGVSCWGEVLEEAKLKLDPMKENKPSGVWMAHYTEKLNDEGKPVPNKVVRLEKVS